MDFVYAFMMSGMLIAGAFFLVYILANFVPWALAEMVAKLSAFFKWLKEDLKKRMWQ